MFLRRSVITICSLAVVLFFLAACTPRSSTPPVVPVLTSMPSAVSTPAEPRQLTICLGEEPKSLYPVNNLSSSARSILAAIYDGPIDTNAYGYQPVILQRLPSLTNGDAQLFPKSVYVGDEVIDAGGTPVTLAPGVKVRPSGCRSDSCTVEYDGKTEIQMDQMQVTFSLLPGLTWSDGEPLTAQDSVYSYNVSANPATTGSTYLVDRTQSYEAVDETTVQWWGKPGYIDPTYFTNFWAPLPKHLWEQISVDQLAESDEAARIPLGWGPYVIQDWLPGDRITLRKNPHYFRLGDGLPHFDTLVFRFVPDPNTALSDLLAGNCDILDPSVRLDGQVGLLRSMSDQGQLRALTASIPVMEELAFGIVPTSYDGGYTPGTDRPNFFGDLRVRQAVALCLDRQQVVDTVLYGLTSVSDSYLPSDHPLFNQGVQKYAYEVAAAGQLLDQAGWVDLDNDPSTPRLASGVVDVLSGTPLELNYFTTNAAQRQQVAGILSASLARCGIKVNVQYVDAETLYAPGPQGVLFGRNFDLAEFAMGSSSSVPSCDWFTGAEVPNNANHWVGVNASGYENPEFDGACQTSGQSLPDDAAYADGIQQTQAIFARDLPVIPLYWRLKVAATRADVCHVSLDPTASSNLWDIEVFDSGSGCLP